MRWSDGSRRDACRLYRCCMHMLVTSPPPAPPDVAHPPSVALVLPIYARTDARSACARAESDIKITSQLMPGKWGGAGWTGAGWCCLASLLRCLAQQVPSSCSASVRAPPNMRTGRAGRGGCGHRLLFAGRHHHLRQGACSLARSSPLPLAILLLLALG